MRESRPGRFCLHLLFALTCLVALPASASAVCTVPGATDATMDPPVQDFAGTFDLTQQGAYVQIPVNVPVGTTGIRIRYCFDNPGNVGNTLDIGVYEPKGSDPFWGPAQRRGWSGSAVRDIGIGINGFTGEATYLADKKAYVSGRTTRAYQPGPIPAGTWAVELGLASIVTPTVDWAVKVETSDDPSWSNAPYVPVAYDQAPANPAPGWYTGDLHVHGEQEPGNATVEQTLDHGFGSLSSGGGGLDFVTLVDHNNDIAARGDVGRHQPAHPGKLIIPGTEVTTYRGHWNNQGPGAFADFRMGPILDAAETQVRAPATPAAELAAARSATSFTQINHPTTFPSNIPAFAALCRGCPWDYSAADTHYANVDAIEIQNGPVNFGGGPNPFTPTAIDFYEGLLAEGHHIAAVGSSDAHQASSASATSAAVGGSATTVFASELSRPAIAEGVREDHTYVKLFGASGPDIRVTAGSPSGARMTLGDTLAGPALELRVRVLGAGPGAARPGTYELQIHRNGNPIDTRTVNGDDFTAPFTYTASGRYSVLVLRKELPQDRLEVYSTPVWFTHGKPSNRFSFGRLTRNRRAGTALLRVRVPSAGRLVLFGKGLRRRTRGARRAGTVKLPVRAKGAVNRRLIRNGAARVRIRVRYRPNFGDPRTKGRPAKLVRRD